MEVSLLQVVKEETQDYIASYPKLQIYSYGKTVHEALSRLKEIIKFYLESAEELNTNIEGLCHVHPEEVFWPLGYQPLSKELM